MTRLDEIRQLYAYDRWASARILAAAETLSDEAFVKDLGSSFPSVRDTLVHILSANWVWLSRWQGTSPRSMPEAWTTSTLAEVGARWREIEAQQQAFLAQLPESELDRVVRYTNLAGTPYGEPLWQLLRHVVNHATYHRGQLTTMLRQLGAAPPATDLIEYFRAEVPTAVVP
jgi:uncharacterized damage-inducible protein DinB